MSAAGGSKVDVGCALGCDDELVIHCGSDSGRESVNEFDSSLDEAAAASLTLSATPSSSLLGQQLCKEQNSSEFYASSGSQTKWYLKPAEEEEIPTTVTTLCVVVADNATVADDNDNDAADAAADADAEDVDDEPEMQQRKKISKVDNDAAADVDVVELLTQSSIFPRTTTTNDGIRNGNIINLSQQIRAVSSPSLTEAVHQEAIKNANDSLQQQQQQRSQPTVVADAVTSAGANSVTCSSSSNNNNNNSSSSSSNATILPPSQNIGVLQKFKRTLTNFNKNQLQITPAAFTAMTTAAGTTATTTTTASNGGGSGVQQATPSPAFALASTEVSGQQHEAADSNSGKYRFGPLIWRSSKERRKTKFNRRDKCNSGDSGIQIELENDEQYTRVLAASSGNGGASGVSSAVAGNTLTASTISMNATSTGNGLSEVDSPKLHAIRRTNSAKTSSVTDQSAPNTPQTVLKKMTMCTERTAPESLPTRSLSQPNGLESYGIGRADLEDSDSDSVASHDEASSTYYPIYAEVLYSFTAAGPQELGLERGTLIEILRKEVGPWWFGRIKKEDASLVEEILDPELGWFPKEFVRIIQYPETDAFFLSHMQQITSKQTMMANSTTVDGEDVSSNNVSGDSTMVVDQSNITTIVIESPPVTPFVASSESPAVAPLAPSRVNVIVDNADILRRSAIRELLDTEVNYVKLLSAICEGYLPAMSKRIDIFSPNSIRLIFSNIAAIYKFQRKFLEALRKGIEQNQIAKVFLKMHKGFLCYSTYCNSYPRALIELESYDRIKDARIILENCRESENLAELPLSAHLLAPVQRICRYPLHLAEIIKTAGGNEKIEDENDDTKTEPPNYEQLDVSQLDIPDTRATVDLALEAMKSITEAVNEGKRHSETIARHQSSFQNFKGPPLHLHSTRFFLQIDATRQKQNLWNSSYTLFLFDNQLVYCKRDIIKRNHFVYKGRIFLDRCRIVNVRDGKMFGHTIKNSLRIYCEARDKWYDFSFRSANRKHRFLSTLALERQFGGKALYVSEMTGFEYNYEERIGDYSDQSDYEMPDSENGGSVGGGVRSRDYTTEQATTSASGESSVPESPAKSSYKSYSDTLPKKSQSRDAISNHETQTGSLGRRRLGNWFRKPKSTTCTPSQSPTHKPAIMIDADQTLTAALAAAATSVELEAPAALVQSSSA